MWFKHAQLFELDKSVKYDPELLSAELSQLIFQPCAKSLPISLGWIPPIGDEEAPLVHAESGHLMFCMQLEEKILPAVVLRDQHMERVKEIETRQERKLYRDEKMRIKEELYHSLLTRAFSKYQKIHGYIDTKSGYLVLNTSTKNYLDLFLSLYSKSVKSFPISIPDIQSPVSLMTHWLKNQRCPTGLAMAYNCSLQNSENERSTARFTHQDLLSDGVQKFLSQGAQVTQMTFIWRDQVQFTLKNNFSISGLTFLDMVQDQRNDSVSETAEERFATDFIIMAETLHHFLLEFMPAMAAIKTTAKNVKQLEPA